MLEISWSAVGIIAAVIFAWSTALLGAIKWLINSQAEALNKRLELIEKSMTKNAQDAKQTELDIEKLRTEMHRDFWRRDDAIRQDVIVGAKIDALAAKMEKWTETMMRHGS